MSGAGRTPPIELTDATRTPLDAERVAVRLTGTRLDELPAGARLLLLVEHDGAVHRFPALPVARQAVGAEADRFEARFAVPAWLAPQLDGRMILQVGETALGVPPLLVVDDGDGAPAPPEAAPPAPVDPEAGDPLGPLRSELVERARQEARLRAEVAALRVRLEQRDAPTEQMQARIGELATELERVRELVGAEEERRREVESRAMVLAADLAAAQGERDAAQGTLDLLRREHEEQRTQIAALEHAVADLDAELARARATAASARAGREALLVELETLRQEIERLGTERGWEAAASDTPAVELQRAEALLAEARALRSTLE